MIQGEGDHLGVFAQNGMDSPAELSGSFAVNNADLKNAAFTTSSKVVEHQCLYLPRLKGMQIEDTVDGQLEGLVHDIRLVMVALK
jgi:hypothetical protein